MGGACCSCFDKDTDESQDGTEMQVSEAIRKALVVAKSMSAPSIRTEGNKVKGSGMALVGVNIEQDAAYWEVHAFAKPGTKQEVWIGVSEKKDKQFYDTLLEKDSRETVETRCTTLMRKMTVSNEDVVGVIVQQSDLPMIQFLVNGEFRHDLSVNRFKGTVYPACFLIENDSDFGLELVFQETDFKQKPPHSRCGPLLVARGII